MGRKDNDTRTFRLPNDLLAALDAEAARTGLSRNVVAFQWLVAGLEIEKAGALEAAPATTTRTIGETSDGGSIQG